MEGYEELTSELREAEPNAAVALGEEIQRLAMKLLARHTDDRVALEKLLIWHVDHFYRLIHRVTFADLASFAFVWALGLELCAALKGRRLALGYLVDNVIAHDRLIPAKRFFDEMGFSVVSPELLAMDQAQKDGVAVVDVNGAHLGRYLDEALSLAEAIGEMFVVQGRSFLSKLDLSPRELAAARTSRFVGRSRVAGARGLAPS